MKPNPPRLLWSPSREMEEDSNLQRFVRWLKKEKGLVFHGYQDLWLWSTQNVEVFWRTLWEYFNITFEGHYDHILTGTTMPHHRWFEGTRLNYAEHVFQKYDESVPAIIFKSEMEALHEISWSELKKKVAALQRYLLQSGIKEGDCVAAYLPCIPEATIAFLATNSIGAIWSSCSPDFGAQSVIDRFAQTRPKILIASSHYSYGGKTFDKTEVIREVINSLPELIKIIIVHDIPNSSPIPSGLFVPWSKAIEQQEAELSAYRFIIPCGFCIHRAQPDCPKPSRTRTEVSYWSISNTSPFTIM